MARWRRRAGADWFTDRNADSRDCEEIAMKQIPHVALLGLVGLCVQPELAEHEHHQHGAGDRAATPAEKDDGAKGHGDHG